jgi:hypothetical protein
MVNIPWHKLCIWILKGNLIVWGINAVLLAVLALSGSSWTVLGLSGYFSKMTLLEAGICLIVGGALAFSASVLPSKTKEYVFKSDELWSMEKLKKSEKRANRFFVLAVILLVQSLIIGFLGA